MHNTRVALLSATLTLAGLMTGCGEQSSQRASASTSASTTSAAALSTPTPLRVTKVTHSGELAWIEFSAPVDWDTVLAGVRIYEDVDLDPGGDFRVGTATPWLDESGQVLVIRANARTPHEVRIQLTDQVVSLGGQRLEGGQFSAAISFSDAQAEVVFELRYRPAPLPLPSGSGLARNVSDDHGDDVSSATPLQGPTDGVIETAADRDWFSLELVEGEVTIRTETTGDTILSLYGPNNQILATNDDDPNGGRHSVVTHTIDSRGRYYAEVRGYSTTTPSYRVSVDGPGAISEAGDEIGTARVVQLDDRVSETLGADDRDHYALDLPAGSLLRCEADQAEVNLIALDLSGRAFADPVHIVASGETLGVVARRYGIGWAELARLNGIANPNVIEVGQRIYVPSTDPLEITAPGGRLYVLAFGFAGATPSYTIGFRGPATVTPLPPPTSSDDHGDDRSGASPLTLGVDRSGVLEQTGDVDWFAVDLQEGKTYVISTVTAGDSILRVLDSQGAELAKNDDDPGGGRQSLLSFRAATGGRHYLEVSGYGQATFSYTLQAGLRQQGALPRPSRFTARSGTDVWHIDFRLRADLFAQDVASHGLSSGDAQTDRLMQDRIKDELLSFLSQKYKLSGDGSAIPRRSWKISFTQDKPPGRAGRNFSREAVGGTHEDGSRTLGVSYLDTGNRRKEDNDDLGELGIFSASIDGRDSTLRPSLRTSDRRYLDGTYLLGDGTPADDRRFRRVRQVASDWAHALAVVTAHEAGHSVGLEHDESNSRGIMKAALSRYLLSDLATRFADASALTLDSNLKKD